MENVITDNLLLWVRPSIQILLSSRNGRGAQNSPEPEAKIALNSKESAYPQDTSWGGLFRTLPGYIAVLFGSVSTLLQGTFTGLTG